MVKAQHYPKAPIIEAVMAFEVTPSTDFDLSCFEKMKIALSEEFRVENIEEMKMEFHHENGQNRNSYTQATVGAKFETYDGKYVVQAKADSYSFSIINHYDQWESFSQEAYKYWNNYIEIFKPQKVTRQALRYINRIDIPGISFELKEYFKLYPQLFDDDIKFGGVGFFLQTQIHQVEGGVANITQALTQPAKAGCC